MRARQGWFQVRRNFAGSCIAPGTARGAHVERLNVQGGEAEWILSEKAMKIVINE